MILLDNTVLSNFALVGRPDLLHTALKTAVTVPPIWTEFEAGVSLGRVPITDYNWLKIVALTAAEQQLATQLQRSLDAGEAAGIAVAHLRQGRLLTDDWLARRIAAQFGVPVSGTLGVLLRLMRTNQLGLLQANQLLTQMIDDGYRSPVKALDSLLKNRGDS